jgi:hypothetical protein
LCFGNSTDPIASHDLALLRFPMTNARAKSVYQIETAVLNYFGARQSENGRSLDWT